MALIGYAALSVLRITTFLISYFSAEIKTLFVPKIFVFTASNGKNSHEGTCFSAAAWKIKSTLLTASSTESGSLTSPIKKLTLSEFIFFLRSSCFFSSLLKTIISENLFSEIALFRYALPNDPVPPVISNLFLA